MERAIDMLKLVGVHAAYGQSQALHGVDLNVGAGEVVCLVGRNGAGKTSTMRAIVQDQIRVTEGVISFDGRSLPGMASYQVVRAGIGYVDENRRVFASLTVLENLRVPRMPAREGMRPWSIDRVFKLFPPLEEYRHRSAGVLSGGEQQMLAIARSLLTNPRLLLLDEPHEGLSPKVAEEVLAAILELKQSGVAMLISEQALFAVKRCADRICIMDRGQVAWAGTPDQFDANPDIAEKYLTVHARTEHG